MTLLVLPLLESIPEAAAAEITAAEWLSEHTGQLTSFGVSFAVSASFWVTHHRLFGRVKRQTPLLMMLNLLWLLVFVFLQVPAAMIYSFPPDRTMIGLYLGTMVANSALLTAMTVYGRRHAELCEEPVPVSMVVASALVTGLYALAMAIGLALPAVSYFALFVLSFTAPLHRLVMRLRRGRRSS